jgi:MoxR-like ATPase
VATSLAEMLSEVLLGRPDAIRQALVALLSGGHVLIEDRPGVGKTLLAKALARGIGGTIRRVQGTPDLLPSELTGVAIYEAASGAWHFRPGPLFANLVLFDELNRATPRTQSALLEAMQEHQVTVDGTTHSLPDPFFVVATQNPAEHAGTFPLVESQCDRFAISLEIGYPPREAEREVLLGTGGETALDSAKPVADLTAIREAVRAVRGVHRSAAVADYVIDLATTTRQDPAVLLGASPRAALDLLRAAQANAVLSDRAFVTPDDVKAVFLPVLVHRIVLHGGEDRMAVTALLESILGRVPVPRG